MIKLIKLFFFLHCYSFTTNAQIHICIKSSYNELQLIDPILINSSLINVNNSNDTIVLIEDKSVILEAKLKNDKQWKRLTNFSTYISRKKLYINDTTLETFILEPIYNLLAEKTRDEFKNDELLIRGYNRLSNDSIVYSNILSINIKNIEKKEKKVFDQIFSNKKNYNMYYFNYNKNARLTNKIKRRSTHLEKLLALYTHINYSIPEKVINNLADSTYMSDTEKLEYSENVLEKDIEYCKTIRKKEKSIVLQSIADYYTKINEIQLAELYSNSLQGIYFSNYSLSQKDRVGFCKNTYKKYYKKFDHRYDANLEGVFNYITNLIEKQKNKDNEKKN